MFPQKIIPHPNLIFILHYIFLNHLLAPVAVLKKIVLLHQLPKKSSYFLITFYSKPFYMENFPKTCLLSVSFPLQGFSDASYNLDYIVCLQVCLYHLQSSQDTISSLHYLVFNYSPNCHTSLFPVYLCFALQFSFTNI